MVVQSGAIRPVLAKQNAPGPFRSETLWLMPPESRHCWVGPRDRPAEVFVFHFASVHPLLENSLPGSRTSMIKLSPEDIAEIERIYRDVESHYLSPKVSSGIAFEVAMLRVSELILRHDRQLNSIPGFDPNAERVLQALQWYRENLSKGVKATDVAKALNISAGHLRRLFLRVHNESPHAVFAQLKVGEACRLMSSTHLSFKEVAGLCGFRGFSEFYRFFRKQMGTSPSVWRSNEFYKQKKVPAPPVG